MNKITIRKDIRDSFGRVYLKKGYKVKMTEENIDRFKKLGVFDQILSQNEVALGNTTQVVEDSQEEREKLNAIYNQFEFLYKYPISIEKVNKIQNFVKGIIFAEEEQEWDHHVRALVNQIEWIYSHSVNVAIISGLIGLALEYEENELYELVLGAFLHDIGMILIPTSILTKQGGLDVEERLMVNKHCELGSAIIQGHNFPQVSRQIILQHHERMDGSGYPLGLKEGAISEAAQIVMVADLIDAATSYRPYHQIKEIADVLKEIIDEAQKYPFRIVKMLVELYESQILG